MFVAAWLSLVCLLACFSVATKWKTKVRPAGQLMVKISTKPNLYTLPKWLATIALTN